MKFATASLLSVLTVAAAAAADVPSLTPENFSEMTDGKTVFIKFFAPWVSTTQSTILMLARCFDVLTLSFHALSRSPLTHTSFSAAIVRR